ADSRQWNWNANAIHTYTPAGGAFRATTSGGVQVEDRELSRSLAVAHGLLPGQSNIDQGSVFGQQFELNAIERTLAFYAQEEFLTLQERLLLSAGFRAERSSALGNTNKYYLFPKASASYRFPGLLGEGSELKLRAAYGEVGNLPKFGDKFTLASRTGCKSFPCPPCARWARPCAASARPTPDMASRTESSSSSRARPSRRSSVRTPYRGPAESSPPATWAKRIRGSVGRS